MNLLKIENLTKTYNKKKGIQNLNLEMNLGDVVALLGPNGSGKTTAMKTMLGLLHKNSGSVSFQNMNIETDLKKILAFTGAVVGKSAHYEYMTAYENLDMIRTFINSITKADILSMLDKVGLLPNKDQKVRTFSTGMKQRLSIAKALLHRPSLLILDEPFSGMDIEGKTKIIALLKSEVENNKLGILISSHQITDVESIITKVCIINESSWLVTEDMPAVRKEYVSLETYYLDVIQGKGRIAI